MPEEVVEWFNARGIVPTEITEMPHEGMVVLKTTIGTYEYDAYDRELYLIVGNGRSTWRKPMHLKGSQEQTKLI